MTDCGTGLRLRPKTAATVLLMATAVDRVGADRQIVEDNRQISTLWAAAEAALRADGVRHAAQVFTDSFDFYFTSVRSGRSWDYRPRTTGG